MKRAFEGGQQTCSLARVQRIAIFRALQLGDLLVAVPAMRAVRHCFPQAEITLISLPWAKTFAQRFHYYIDRFVAFSGYPGLKEVPVDAERTRNFIEEQRAYGYDLVIQMHGSGQISNPCVLAFNARMTAGYYEGTQPEGLTFAAPYVSKQHEITRNLELVALLQQQSQSGYALKGRQQINDLESEAIKEREGATGCASDNSTFDTYLEFPLFESDTAEASMLLQSVGAEHRPRIGLHPGARPSARRWPAEYFASLADELIQRFDAQIILTGSTDEETTAQSVLTHMQTRDNRIVNLVGKTSLGGLAAILGQLDLFISNDTGPAHLAYAVHTPSITIFGPADYQRWAPLDRHMHEIVRHPVACSPCTHWDCPIDHRCLRGLMPTMVLSIAQKFLWERAHLTHLSFTG